MRDQLYQSKLWLERARAGDFVPRIAAFLCILGFTAACVDLDKPEKVAECAARGDCVNSPKVDAPLAEDTASSANEAGTFEAASSRHRRRPPPIARPTVRPSTRTRAWELAPPPGCRCPRAPCAVRPLDRATSRRAATASALTARPTSWRSPRGNAVPPRATAISRRLARVPAWTAPPTGSSRRVPSAVRPPTRATSRRAAPAAPRPVPSTAWHRPSPSAAPRPTLASATRRKPARDPAWLARRIFSTRHRPRPPASRPYPEPCRPRWPGPLPRAPPATTSSAAPPAAPATPR